MIRDHELWRERYAARVADFTAGRISADLFRAHLHSLGFRGHEVESEVRLYAPEGVAQ